MNKVKFVLSKVYWFLVAGVPFYPYYALNELQERLACAYGTPCFEHGLPYFVEGSTAGIFTGIVLWPMCIWMLGGKYLWKCLSQNHEKA